MEEELIIDQRILVKTDIETLQFFIRTWKDFCPSFNYKELAKSVEDNFNVFCTLDDVIKTFFIEIEEEDIKCQVKNLNIIY